MFTRIIIISLIVWVFQFSLKGQSIHQSWPLSISISNNSTQLPSWRLFPTPIHPGITIGTEISYNRHPRHSCFQSFNLGYVYHRYLHHAINLYSEVGYRYRVPKGFSIAPKLGVGYQHEIFYTGVYEFNGLGYYEQINKGRAQFTAGFALQTGYAFGKMREWNVFLEYRFFIQTPFIKSYVPILPNTVFQLGVSRKLSITPKDAHPIPLK